MITSSARIGHDSRDSHDHLSSPLLSPLPIPDWLSIEQQFLKLEHGSGVLPPSSLQSTSSSPSPSSQAGFTGSLRADPELTPLHARSQLQHSPLAGPNAADVLMHLRQSYGAAEQEDYPGMRRKRLIRLQMMMEDMMLLDTLNSGQCAETDGEALQMDADDWHGDTLSEPEGLQADVEAKRQGAVPDGTLDLQLLERQALRMSVMVDKLRVEKDGEASQRIKAEKDLAAALEKMQVRVFLRSQRGSGQQEAC
jgi:hypothetical protein